jgi:biofilm PGA synthesis N-glycosyltransferase PgaC
MNNPPSYVLVTAARNEAQFIEHTIISVVQQSVRPLKWVIVSDGSTDGTDEIVATYAAHHDWIELIRLAEHADRNFAGKAGAVAIAYKRVADIDFDVIGNLDADVSFEADYLAFLVDKFVENPRLGVTGTPYREENSRHDERFKNPEHVSGACQMFRRKCFQDIGGYRPIRSGGIDFVALLSAQAMGWQTRRFDERSCLHHRNVGSGQHPSAYAGLLNLGKKDYLLGSHPIFEIFRAIFRMKNRPYIVGGILVFIGYFSAMLRRLERTMPADLTELRRRDQMKRLGNAFRHPLRAFGRRSVAAGRP